MVSKKNWMFEKIRIFFLFLIFIYQRFISFFSHGSCRYYPTCSTYTKLHIQHNTFIVGIFFSVKRLLKCNQVFDGGFDYPVVFKKNLQHQLFLFKPNRNFRIIVYFFPMKKNYYYIVPKIF